MSLLKLNQYVLKALSFLILLACAVQFISFGKQTLTFFDLYSFLLIALPAGYLLFTQEPNEFTSESNFTGKDYGTIGLFFLVNIGLHIYGLERFSLWFDELSQLYRATNFPFVEASGLHMQPPLDYILQKFTISTFGVSDATIRLNTVLCSVVASTLLFALLKRIAGSYLVSALLICLVIFEAWFFKFSFDARPVGLGYLTLILFLVSFINILKPEATSLKKAEFRQIMCVALLFVLSIGYQPLLILGTFILLVAVRALILFKNKDHKSYYLSLTYPLVGAILLFIPLQIKIYLDSIMDITSKNLADKISNFSLNNFEGLYKVYGVYFSLLFILFLIMILLRQFKKKTKTGAFEANFFVATCLLFFITSLFIFSVPLNFRFQEHYVLFVLPLIILSSAYLYKSCEDCFSISLHKRIFKLLFLFVLILALPKFNLTFAQDSKRPMFREDVRTAYSIVFNRSSDGDYLTSLSFPKKAWSPIEFNLGAGAYYTSKVMRDKSKSHADIVRGRDIPILSLYWILKEKRKVSNLYIIFNRRYEQVAMKYDELRVLKNVDLIHLENVLLLKLENTSGDLQKEWFNVLDVFEKKTEAPQSWVFQVLLAQKHLLTQQKAEYLKTMDQLKEMTKQNDNRPVVNQIIEFLEAESDQTLKN